MDIAQFAGNALHGVNSMKPRSSLLVSLTVLVPGLASAGVIFTDGTFNPADYSYSTAFISGASVTYGQCTSCGDPGYGLQINVDVTASSSGYSQAFINNTFSYDPLAQGAISGISASVDKDEGVNFAGTDFGNTFRPTIEQDGNFYLAFIPGPPLTTGAGGGSTGYNLLSGSGLVASDFEEYDFATGSFVVGSPNFDGDPMLFGLTEIATINGESSGATFFADFDNLSFDITTVATVPETTSLALLATGLAGLLLLRGRRLGLRH
jgi:hypothetical protein